jgi:hypothetical protein
MHGPMLARPADHFDISNAEHVVPGLALGNTMIALANHRRYAFFSARYAGVRAGTGAMLPYGGRWIAERRKAKVVNNLGKPNIRSGDAKVRWAEA